MTDLPVIRLKPKANARAIRHGGPWVFANEVVTDRRTKAIAPGALAVLEDAGREPLALVAANPASKIIGRVLSRDVTEQVDQAWFAARLQRALDLRERLYDAPFYRLVHAEADGLPGLVIDRFGDTCVLQPNAAFVGYHKGNGKDLGGEFQFRTGGEIAWRFDDWSRLAIAFHHISNAGIYDDNPGTELLVLTYSVPFTQAPN